MTGFHAKSKALEVIAGHNLSGYETIVTGGASGIGVETVRALATAGARVVIATRNLDAAKECAAKLSAETGSKLIEAEKLDLGSLKSIREFVARYLATGRALNILINNAGVMACPLSHTEDGFETQIGTNHFGHFALTVGLLPALKAGAKKLGKNSRVVNVSSLAHGFASVDLDDINFKTRAYDKWVSYGQSKTANIWFSIELTRRYQSEGVVSNAIHPGGIMTNLQRHAMEDMKQMGYLDSEGKPKDPRFKTVEEGASTSIWAAVADELEGKGGLYFENCGFTEETTKERVMVERVGRLPYAYDAEGAKKLWELSEKLIANPPNKAN